MSVLSFVGDAVSAVSSVVDKFVITDAERAEAKREIEGVLNERLKLAYDDLANAREMQISAMLSKDAFVRRFSAAYALVFTIAFFVVVGMLMFVDLPDKAQTVLDMLFGALAAGLTQILGFFYGSSEGSRNKDIARKF